MTDHPTDGRPRGPRPLTRGEERVESIHTPTRSELVERIAELEQQLETLKAQDEEHTRSWQRAAADFANYRRRTEEERTQFSGRTIEARLSARGYPEVAAPCAPEFAGRAGPLLPAELQRIFEASELLAER